MKVRIADSTANGVPYVVEIDGEIDLATVKDLEDPVIHAIENGCRPVIIDLSECSFIDSTGLRLLVRAHHLLARDGAGDGDRHDLAIVCRDQVASVMRQTAMDEIVAVAPSRAEAEGILELGRRT